MTGERIMVVEDDPTVRDVVRRYLERDGLAVELIDSGEVALERALADPPALIILDLMLPGLSGLEVCRTLRARQETPIVMLTALGEESDRVTGLEIGADDYVTKPFSPRELALRVRSVLRRSGSAPARAAQFQDGALVVDAAARRATLGGAVLALTTREFDLLHFFIAHSGEAFNRAELLEKVWGWTFGDHATVTVHVRRLREKIERDATAPSRIVTVWGVGYRYDGEVTEA
ncbi:MAG TPA: response regulator transcription factor [Mycobacteriales bacterium]|nr:response regulator transcription factor [Mycobacteriales bacterium]